MTDTMELPVENVHSGVWRMRCAQSGHRVRGFAAGRRNQCCAGRHDVRTTSSWAVGSCQACGLSTCCFMSESLKSSFSAWFLDIDVNALPISWSFEERWPIDSFMPSRTPS